MRIQHNIMAMNAYRNYNTNTSALSKNLEKLSSGYKINRAGDDAAGLAISEKMRAQISGLNAAQKNVKDGISLVKTAEGAMQEIQDMLNRMKYLATQSANGTYDDDVDRFNLQKEVEALSSEIDRIADSANFNGINLLDGKMGFGATGSTTNTTDPDTDPTNPTTPETKTYEITSGLDGGGLTGVKITGLTEDIKSVKINTATGSSNDNGKAEATFNTTSGELTITVTGKAGTGTEVTAADITAAIKSAANLTADQQTALKDVSVEATIGTIAANTGTAVTPQETKAVSPGELGRAAGARAGGENSTFTPSAENVGTGKAVTEAAYEGTATGDIKVSVAQKDVTAVAAKASGTGSLANISFEAGAAGKDANGITIKFVATDDSLKADTVSAAWDKTSNTVTVTLGNKTAGYGATDIQTAIQNIGDKSGDGGVDFSAFKVTGDGTIAKPDAASDSIGSVSLSGGADAGKSYVATATVDGKTAEAVLEDDGTATFQGNAAGLTVKFDTAQFKDNALAEVTIGTAKAAESKPTDNNKTDTDKIASGTKVEIDMSAAQKTGKNFADGDTIKIGDQVYKFVEGSSDAGDGKAARATDINVTLGANFDDSMKNLVAEVEKNKATTGISASYANGKLTLTTTKDFASADEMKKAANVTVTSTNEELKTAVEKAWNDAVDEAASGKKSGNGSITLQIGDTADPFNQLTVKIGDMHVSALGKRKGTADLDANGKKTGTYTYADVADGQSIADIDISTLGGAQNAISIIKDAINYVSSVRGDLGATQNRLEHTANNLSVMTENITDAESTIRDTDVAEEMMAYTKNNILIQSAQAMLAQANAVPQGVLQLLG